MNVFCVGLLVSTAAFASFGALAQQPTSDYRSPAERAAAQILKNKEAIQSVRQAEELANLAARRALEAAERAVKAAEEAEKARKEAAHAATEAIRAARRAPASQSSPQLNSVARPSKISTQNDRNEAGRVLVVGPHAKYRVPSAAAKAAQNGDVIEIHAGTYTGDIAAWRANNLVIRGVGGRVLLVAAGKASEGKAIWVIKGNNTTIENIEFSGCRVSSLNGAGIRQEGAGLIVRNSIFSDNEIGILTGHNPKSDILIDRSEFRSNRINYELYASEGRRLNPHSVLPGHNIYIGRVRSFTLRHSYIHAAQYGHNVKSRAIRNVIAYNRIGDEKDGRSSYAIDIPEGGWTLVLGNLIQQGERTENSTVISHGAEKPSSDGSLFVVNNTFVNDRPGGFFVREVGRRSALVVNNIFYGTGVPLLGNGTLKSNLIVSSPRFEFMKSREANPGTGKLVGNLVTTDPGLRSVESFNYRLDPGSPAIDAGEDPGEADGVSLRPESEYVHPRSSAPRSVVGSRIDIGAYEFTPSPAAR